VAPAQFTAPQTAIPAGFVPSIIILIGGQASAISQSLEGREEKKLLTDFPDWPIIIRGAPPTMVKKSAEDKPADKGEPPKV
jgi:hypothetical protein